MRIAFLASHNGSSAQAITQACASGRLKAAPTLLISNNPDCKALTWARAMKLKTAVINSANTADPDAAIAGLFEDNQIDLVICSGYMKLIGPRTIESVHGAIVNVHPALLPRHGGKGMYGRKVHEAVIRAGDVATGITIHLVDREYDRGRILAQKSIPVFPDDDAANIEEKVKAAEPEFYIETLGKILDGSLSLG